MARIDIRRRLGSHGSVRTVVTRQVFSLEGAPQRLIAL